MTPFTITAHRGVCDRAPENTLPAFERAIELGADAVELDVRLTADRVPVVYHYFYLDGRTSHLGPIFNYSFAEVCEIQVFNPGGEDGCIYRISTLADVLEAIAGKTGLEIEVKGPEPESATLIGQVLRAFHRHWESMEVTSYEPLMLHGIQTCCPGLATDLLFPRSEPWMKQDVTTYTALHRSKLARARAVHLHPSQLTSEVVETVRDAGLEIHAWDVNDQPSLQQMAILGIPVICTDRFEQANRFRETL